MTAKYNMIDKPSFRFELGGGFVLLIALIWFFDESGLIAALFPVIIIHELGHLLMMLFLGARPTKLSASLSGLSLDYSGYLSELQEMLTALSGPASGLVFAFICGWLGNSFGSEYLLMCSGLGFVINIFNCLPALPLDGGRFAKYLLQGIWDEEKALGILRFSGIAVSFSLLIFGLYFIAIGVGCSLFLAGVWLSVLQNKSCK